MISEQREQGDQLWGIIDAEGRRWVVWDTSKPQPGFDRGLDDSNDNELAHLEAGTYTVLDEPFASTDAADAWIERRDQVSPP